MSRSVDIASGRREARNPRLASHYCPLVLFAQSSSSIKSALASLLLDPHNNLKIFLGGSLVYTGNKVELHCVNTCYFVHQSVDAGEPNTNRVASRLARIWLSWRSLPSASHSCSISIGNTLHRSILHHAPPRWLWRMYYHCLWRR
jgi:hypothetical protein